MWPLTDDRAGWLIASSYIVMHTNDQPAARPERSMRCRMRQRAHHGRIVLREYVGQRDQSPARLCLSVRIACLCRFSTCSYQSRARSIPIKSTQHTREKFVGQEGMRTRARTVSVGNGLELLQLAQNLCRKAIDLVCGVHVALHPCAAVILPIARSHDQ